MGFSDGPICGKAYLPGGGLYGSEKSLVNWHNENFYLYNINKCVIIYFYLLINPSNTRGEWSGRSSPPKISPK